MSRRGTRVVRERIIVCLLYVQYGKERGLSGNGNYGFDTECLAITPSTVRCFIARGAPPYQLRRKIPHSPADHTASCGEVEPSPSQAHQRLCGFPQRESCIGDVHGSISAQPAVGLNRQHVPYGRHAPLSCLCRVLTGRKEKYGCLTRKRSSRRRGLTGNIPT